MPSDPNQSRSLATEASLALEGILACPRDGGILRREAEWVCPSCKLRVPEVGGIVRFTQEKYAASFGRQWNRYDVMRPEEDAAVFRAKAGVDAADLAGLRVLDAGCGGGRYSHLLGGHHAFVVGVDLSLAVEKARSLCADMPNVQIVQADLLELPIAAESFDFAFSIGVMHHSSDPRRAFARVASAVKPGGRLAVWLYRRNTLPQECVNSALRALTTRMPARMLEKMSVGLGLIGGVPLLNKSLNKVVNFSNHADWTLRVCDNFDWYAPRYQSHHSLAELKQWFHEEGFSDLRELRPVKRGLVYEWSYDHNLLIGSGVNVLGTKRALPIA